jgi:DNA-binding LytR/AlgR family response regulator
MYEIGICDDQLPICQDIKQRVTTLLLKRDIDIRTHIYSTGKELLEEGIAFDILFMDIELKDEDGFDIVREYPHKENARVIFLTSHVEEMCNGYKVRAYRFLTKPINEEHFTEAVNSAIDEVLQEKRLIVSKDGEQRSIRASEIIYAEAGHRGALARTQTGDYDTGMKIEDLVKFLNLPQFYRTHRTYIVNMAYIDHVNNQEIIMSIGEKITVSRLKCKDFNTKYFDYIRSQSRGL